MTPRSPDAPSPHEGLIVQSGPHIFRIHKGRRIWLSPPPPEISPPPPEVTRHD
jgi:hypothetical protein